MHGGRRVEELSVGLQQFYTRVAHLRQTVPVDAITFDALDKPTVRLPVRRCRFPSLT